MRIAIIDDHGDDRALLAEILKEALPAKGVVLDGISEFESGGSFLAVYEHGCFDIVFLDIYMNGVNGVDTARELRKRDQEVKLVFVTTSNDFASESYEVKANYYLKKPCDRATLLAALDMILPASDERVILLPDGRKIIPDNFIWSECAGHNIHIHCKFGDDISARLTERELIGLLSGFDCYLSCSKGILINLNAVSKITDDSFITLDGSRVPISRRKMNEAKTAYSEFVFHKIRQEVAR